MTLDEKFNILLERVRRWADLERTHAEVTNEATIELRDAGITYEEVFDSGICSAEAYHALECRELLRSIKELGNELLN